MWPIFSRFPEQPVAFYFISLRSKGLTNIDTWLIATCCNLASVITILHLSELETGGVRHLGHQITSPPEQRRVVLLVCKYRNTIFITIDTNM